MTNLIPIERIENKIYLIRGQKVILDFDLAWLYEVKTKRLKEQVRRNNERFPSDFMFLLTEEELQSLRSQIATLETKGKGKGKYSKYLPFAFTEQGIAMLSSVLKSKRAVQVNIAIMRVFVKLNRILTTHVEVSGKLKELEQGVLENKKDIQSVFGAIRKLMVVEEKPKRKIGFLRGNERE
ncbi:MAG: ORF6N domain-containing protein [Candidatus Saganbacteria bacterium]|nr:ORF6N domain-containing protein [Candidatus Saganbacteria bacterium]